MCNHLKYISPSPQHNFLGNRFQKTQLTNNETNDQNQQENTNMLLYKYKEIVSTLPSVLGWNQIDKLYQYEGFWFYGKFLEPGIFAQEHFKAQPNDIIISSFTKTGTTWLKALADAIVTRNQTDQNPLLSKVPRDCIPFLEVDFAQKSSDFRDPNSPLLSTHMPYNVLPSSIITSSCKIVYIWRDPKDTFVSLCHFVSKIMKNNGSEVMPTEDAFDLFCKGVVNYGPYLDHILGYYKASLEFPKRFLFLNYEEMKKNTKLYVKMLANFIGNPFTLEEEANGVVENIISFCSFGRLSNLEVNKSGKHRKGTKLELENNVYFRKGEVVGWKNESSASMAARIDQIFEEKLKDCNLNYIN